MERIAVYAGSFDPLTNGHVWMIDEGRKLFDTLIVAIGENPAKKPMFTVGERLDMLRWQAGFFNEHSAPYNGTIEVDSFPHLFLVDYARKKNARFILRGIRNGADADYEAQLNNFNMDFEPDVRTVFLMPPPELTKVSSSAVRGLIGPEGWEGRIGKYVPAPAYDAIVRKVKGA